MSSKPPPCSPVAPYHLRTPSVNGSAIVAAAAVGFALVVCVLAWIVTHPHRAKADATPEPAVVALAPSPRAELPPPPPPAAPVPAPRPVVVVEATPAVHHPMQRDGVVNKSALVEEAPPPLPPPSRPEPAEQPAESPAVVAKAPPAEPAGETYGTEVLFLNNPEAAKDLARREKKLLFIMHISGNFEDSCFT